MDYKIEFYKNVNSVSKNNINKMGLENMFDHYNGNDVSFLRFVATLNNNNWKASKEAENDDSFAIFWCDLGDFENGILISLLIFIILHLIFEIIIFTNSQRSD